MERQDASQQEQTPPKAIVCVHAQRDEPLYRELQRYLVLWQKQGRIYWADPAAVQQADLVLLLVSPSFFATTACHTAMVRAIEVRTERGVPVVPLLARASDWKESDCGGLQALPDNEIPIAEWDYQERAYENICEGLARIFPDLPALGMAPPEGLHLFQAPKLPESYVARLKEFAAAKQLLLQRQSTQATAITTALRGAGGFGKTTLAQALCHDPEIQVAFPDGILWVELGEQRRRPLDILNSILFALEPSQAGAITLEKAKQRWRAALQDQVCLLVIDDVWQVETLLPLLEGGPSCRRLVTTRNDLLLPRNAARVLVDAMEPQEAVTVLCQGLPETIHQAVYWSNLESLAARLGCWPLLLALANGLLTDLVDAHLSISEALATIAQAYETRGVMAFRLDNIEERQRTVDACLRVSLQHLETFTHPHYHAMERYQELAVFPEDTDIPLDTLQIYWKGTGGLELWETKDLCIRLHRLSLLLTCDLGKGTIRLHDVLRSYLVQRAGPNLPLFHARLLSAYWQVLGLQRWADLPANDGYLWQHLILHLCQTGRREALQATLTDLGYLTRKALYVGVVALEADLLLATTSQQADAVEPVQSFFEFLHRTIVRSSHLLQQAHTPAEMGGLLLSHLGSQPAFATQRLALERELPRPFLTARHPLPDKASSALLRTLHGHTNVIHGCAVSPDGSFIVSASNDQTLKVWDAATGAERLSLTGHSSSVNGCAVSPNGSFIVSASSDQTLKVWDAATGAERLSLTGHSSSVNSCAVSPDGSFIVSASSDQTLKVWDAATGAERLSLTGHSSSVNSCAVSPDGSFIVSAAGEIIGSDQTLKVWDTATGAERLSLTGHSDYVRGCAVSPDGSFIVSASNDQTLKVWDAATGAERLSLTGHSSSVNDCAVSPDGSFIVSASSDGTLKVWDAATGAERLSLTGHSDYVRGCAVSPNGRWIVSASWDSTLKFWDAATGAERLSLTGHSDYVRGCAVSPNGQWIVSASNDQMLKVWDAATGAERLSLTGHSSSVNGCAVSPDGSFIVSASNDQTLKIWDAATGAERLSLTGHTSVVRGCAVSPDGSFIVSASLDQTLKVWDAATGAERLSLTGHSSSVNGCAVSPNGRWIVSASLDQTLKVWDAATGAERLSLTGHSSSVNGCAVSPNGRWIVSASWDSTLKVWDTATGAERLSLTGHTSVVRGCAVSPDGSFIISASADQMLKIWDATTGRCVLTFPVDGELSGCAVSPDGEHVVACGVQGVSFLRLVA